MVFARRVFTESVSVGDARPCSGWYSNVSEGQGTRDCDQGLGRDAQVEQEKHKLTKEVELRREAESERDCAQSRMIQLEQCLQEQVGCDIHGWCAIADVSRLVYPVPYGTCTRPNPLPAHMQAIHPP